MLKDELDLDGRPNLNLASFVGTYMDREADSLIMENISKNMSDADEYPAMMAIHARCVSIIAHLWGGEWQLRQRCLELALMFYSAKG